jgi:hypothetical protein
MANDEHVALLKKGVTAWNQWRQEKYEEHDRAVEKFTQTGDDKELQTPDSVPDLSGATLCRASLTGIDLEG